MKFLSKLAKEYPLSLVTALSTAAISALVIGWYQVVYDSILKKIPQELAVKTLLIIIALVLIGIPYLYELSKKSKKINQVLKENEKIKIELFSLKRGLSPLNLPEESKNLLCCIAAHEQPFSPHRKGSIYTEIRQDVLAQNFGISDQKMKFLITELFRKGLLDIDNHGRLFGLSDKGRSLLHQLGLLE